MDENIQKQILDELKKLNENLSSNRNKDVSLTDAILGISKAIASLATQVNGLKKED